MGGGCLDQKSFMTSGESYNTYFDVDNYLVQPHPVEFTEQPDDLVYFSGSDISLYCETNCVPELVSLKNSSCAVTFEHNGLNLDYDHDNISYNFTLSSHYWTGRRTLSIFNANESVAGWYHCITGTLEVYSLFTDIVDGRPVHLQMAGMVQYNTIHTVMIMCLALEPIGGEVQVISVAKGGRVMLSCMGGIYPSPDNISWWRNDINCDQLHCLVCDLICLVFIITSYGFCYSNHMILLTSF